MRDHAYRVTFALLLWGMFGLQSACAIAAPAENPSTTELQVVKRLDPNFLHRVAQSVKPDADGAVGQNRSGFDQVGVQNQSAYIVPDALVRRDTGELGRAIDILEYGLRHQRPDGSFEYADTGKFGAPPTALTKTASAAFFYYDLGRSLNLLRESAWFSHSNGTASERSRVRNLAEQVNDRFGWFEEQAPVLRTDLLGTNRTLAYAMAYYLVGKAIGSQKAKDLGLSFLTTALDRENGSGTFPESGGFDSSYQGVSLFDAEVLYLEMNPTDAALRQRLWSAIERGIGLEQRAIEPDGSMSTQGNTRVSATGERVFGVTKRIDGRSVSLALMYHASLTNNDDLQQSAKAVARRYYLLGP